MYNATISIAPHAVEALKRLNACGYEAWVVGGCVRDSLIGRTPGDWDICTSALPEQTRQVFEKDFHVIDTGIKHGTVTVVIDGHPLEITTYRTEGSYSDNRRPDSVTFVSDVKMDLSRRDLTINAMAYNENNGLLDIFGGQDDLDRRIVRCVGQPELRFGEDALRILRTLRFAAVLDFEIEAETADAAHKMAGLLGNIAVERIFIELKKLVTAPARHRILREFGDIIAAAVGQEPNNSDALSTDPVVAFCLTFGDAADVLNRLKAPKALINSAAAIKSAAVPQSLPEALTIKGSLGDENLGRLISYFQLIGQPVDFLQQAAVSHIPCRISQLDITGKDLKELGISPGPTMGLILSSLLDAVKNGRCINQKSALLAAAAKIGDL